MLVLDSIVIRHSPFVIALHWLIHLAPLSTTVEGLGVEASAEVRNDVKEIGPIILSYSNF